MCSALVHRGPDEDGYYVSDGIGMGMRRLRIIDLDSGHQPVCNEDGTVWTVFNGEIYNYAELRRELEGRGHRFYTSSDTEVIVHLYEEHGDDCVKFMRGMFGFAIWDLRAERLLLARDRLGIKPLYYVVCGERLCFASELKALLEIEGMKRAFDWPAVGHLVSFLTTPHDQSIISGIRKLPPAHILTVTRDGARMKISEYWDVRFEPESGRSEESFAEELRSILDESVRLHCVAEVPVGAFLSGGIDSSAVVATMARHTRTPVKTFSIGFREKEFDESGSARAVALAFGTEHREEILVPDALDVIDRIVWHLDEPFGDSSAIPTYMVSQLASKFVTVVLSGDGGDELFAGYEKYLVEQRERRFDNIPAAIKLLARAMGGALPEAVRGKNLLTHFGKEGAERRVDSSTLFRMAQFRRLFAPEVLPMVLPGSDPSNRHDLQSHAGHWLSAMQYADLKRYLPLDILTKVDRMSMAHSIETRVPLLDHKLVEFSARIPPDLQLRESRTKNILKLAMKGILADDVLHRPKHGFAVPLGSWFRGRLEEYARDLLLSSRSRQRGIFSPAYIEKLLDMHARGRELDLHLWTLISLELWCRIFMDAVPARHKEQVPHYEVQTSGSSRMPWMPDPVARIHDV